MFLPIVCLCGEIQFVHNQDSSDEEDDELENHDDGSYGRHTGGKTTRNGLTSATLSVRLMPCILVTLHKTPCKTNFCSFLFMILPKIINNFLHHYAYTSSFTIHFPIISH